MVTRDGGFTWKALPSGSGPHGFRSAVIYLARRRMWIATGTSGSDYSADDGVTWKQFDEGSFNALSSAGGALWAVGAKGADWVTESGEKFQGSVENAVVAERGGLQVHAGSRPGRHLLSEFLAQREEERVAGPGNSSADDDALRIQQHDGGFDAAARSTT